MARFRSEGNDCGIIGGKCCPQGCSKMAHTTTGAVTTGAPYSAFPLPLLARDQSKLRGLVGDADQLFAVRPLLSVVQEQALLIPTRPIILLRS